jgi:hypothetical protein
MPYCQYGRPGQIILEKESKESFTIMIVGYD